MKRSLLTVSSIPLLLVPLFLIAEGPKPKGERIIVIIGDSMAPPEHFAHPTFSYPGNSIGSIYRKFNKAFRPPDILARYHFVLIAGTVNYLCGARETLIQHELNTFRDALLAQYRNSTVTIIPPEKLREIIAFNPGCSSDGIHLNGAGIEKVKEKYPFLQPSAA